VADAEVVVVEAEVTIVVLVVVAAVVDPVPGTPKSFD
jgi:hypothetical protein